MSTLSSYEAWFSFNLEDGSTFSVYNFKGHEQLNEPYKFEIELVSKNVNEDLTKVLGSQATLTISGYSGFKRYVHGQILQAKQLHTGNVFTHYHVVLVPRCWFLNLNSNHRIFQNKTVPQIIESILKEQIFLSETYELKLKEKYEERDYCVQYAESDLHFITRLCEEEGICFYFEHSEDKHILCFSDASGGSWIESEDDEGSLRFFAGSGQVADKAVINRLTYNQQINSDASSYREWNFAKPSLDLEVFENEKEQRKAPIPSGLNLEKYQYPHLYQLQDPGNNFVKLQLQRQLTFFKCIEGKSNVSRLNPGFAFSLLQHPREDLNDKWFLFEVEHFGEQPQVLEHEAPDRGFTYTSNFKAIPFETRYVAELNHPKVKIIGDQTAIVVGPEGQEIYVNEHAQVKVDFHWDRRDLASENSSCWVRVSQAWAGGQYGNYGYSTYWA